MRLRVFIEISSTLFLCGLKNFVFVENVKKLLRRKDNS